MTRSGIIPKPNGDRPLDEAIPIAIEDSIVMHLLTPFQTNKRAFEKGEVGSREGEGKGRKSNQGKSSGKGNAPQAGRARGTKGKGKGKGKGKKASADSHGNRICWGYNGGNCTEKAVPNSAGIPACSRGIHVCARPGCFAQHPMSDPSCPLWG